MKKIHKLIVVLAFVSMVSSITGIVCGCAQLGKLGDWAKWWDDKPDIVKTNGGDAETAFEDAINAKEIVWHGVNVSEWKVTHNLVFKGKFGGQVRMEQKATKEWPTRYDVVGVCWMIVKDSGGKWNAYQWDYIRPGQVIRHFPWHPPKEGHGDYRTVKEGEEFYVMISGLCRDQRRNVQFRTTIAKGI